MLHPEVSETCPPDFVDAVWTEFFAARNRGVSIPVNLGWLNRLDGLHIGLRNGRRLVAGLVLRRFSDPAEGARNATGIGLVWVDPMARGQGHSTALLSRAIAEARQRGMGDMLLWTSKPGVYKKLGFVPSDNALFGEVISPEPGDKPDDRIARQPWPDRSDNRGLPAFATSGSIWRGFNARLTTLDTPTGCVLAEWSGTDRDVTRLIMTCMPPAWRLNALIGDTLPNFLAASGAQVSLEPNQLRMILTADSLPPRQDAYRLRILDRV